jgi:histone-lysine N-methyltransferase SETD2
MSRRSPIIQDESNTDPELEPLAPSDPACPDRPATFKFITENVYCSEVVTSRERKKGKRMVCDCQFDPEQDDPEDACGEICLNRLLMIECGSRCPCGEYCNNKRFQRGVYAQVEVFKTDKKGWGLRALTDIPQGTFVMEYCGEVISPVEFEERKKQYTIEKRRHYYFMSLRSDEVHLQCLLCCRFEPLPAELL